jgi:DNA-binding MarR family transcriptional regulator
MTTPEGARSAVTHNGDHRTSATPPSHGRDTGTSYIHSSYPSSHKHGGSDDCSEPSNIAEVEIATDSSAHARTRQNSLFLKGPIPLVYLHRAAVLQGKALAVYICITHQCDLTSRSTVTIPTSLLTKFGVSRDAKARAIRELEQAGLVSVEREPGRAVRVTLELSSPSKKEARGSGDSDVSS